MSAALDAAAAAVPMARHLAGDPRRAFRSFGRRREAVIAMASGGFGALGGGWVRLPDGRRVQGWDAAAAILGRSIEAMARGDRP